MLSKEVQKLCEELKLDPKEIEVRVEIAARTARERGIDFTKPLLAGFDMNGPLTSAGDVTLQPYDYLQQCLQLLAELPRTEISLVSGFDTGTLRHFRDKIGLKKLGIIGERGMVYERGEKLFHIYPHKDEETINFFRALLRLAAKEKLKVAIQPNASSGNQAVYIEADHNAKLLQHPLVRGRKFDPQEIFSKYPASFDIEDGSLVVRDDQIPLAKLYQAMTQEYPLMSFRVQKTGSKFRLSHDAKDKEGFTFDDLKGFSEKLAKASQRKPEIHKDWGIDFFTEEAVHGKYSKERALKLYGREVFGTDDFIMTNVGDRESDVLRSAGSIFFPQIGTEAYNFASNGGLKYLTPVTDGRDYALLLYEVRRRALGGK